LAWAALGFEELQNTCQYLSQQFQGEKSKKIRTLLKAWADLPVI
jgi:Mn-containing catalase